MPYRFIPNFLSFLRIVFSLFFIFFMLSDSRIAAIITFFICSISDILDGYIARKYNFQTDFGRYLDPLADKILVLSGFIILHIFYSSSIQLWMIVVIVFRDLAVTLLRWFLLIKGKVMLTSNFSKLKTVYQIIVIHIILLFHIYNSELILSLNLFSINLIFILMLLSVIYTFISGLHYYIINFKNLVNE